MFPPGYLTFQQAGQIIKKPQIISADEHGIAVRQLCPSATEVVRRLQEASFDSYIVGGSVRDLLLGRVPKDFDVATVATPEQVKDVFPRSRIIGRRFRLVHVRHEGVLVEVATFRADQPKQRDTNRSGRILRDNVFGTLEEDALRRDFTINALFLDPVNGEIRDFTGGYDDLANRRLRLIGDPVTRYREDAVRLLRAARFVAKLGIEPEPSTARPIPELAGLLEDIPPARLFEETCKLFLTGHGNRTLEALQRFGLTRSLFPVLPGAGGGKAETHALLWSALRNTDQRVAEEKSVTPAFLFAALLWQPVEQRARELEERDHTALQALEIAGEEVIARQVRRTAIPRRFSAVTRQIWEMQARFRRTRGKRALSVLRHPRFRAAYDFLLLRAEQDDTLAELKAFWTEAQKGQPPPARSKKRRPRRRGRRSRASRGAG